MAALRAPRVLACVLAAGFAGAAPAQWRSVDLDGTGLRAEVRNDGGAVVHITLETEGRVIATFRLPQGLVSLDSRSCPTWQIDDNVAEAARDSERACEVDAGSARFPVGRVQDSRVRSPTLLRLMDGRELVVRYRLRHAGYGIARFSLRRSKQALSDVLGESVEVIAD